MSIKTAGIFVSTIFVAIFSFSALADQNPNSPGGETDDVCSPANAEVCAHIHFAKELVTSEEGIFIVHVDTPNNQPVANFAADLFMDMGSMDMGHGSAPLAIQPLGNNHFRISSAWFVMTGTWFVRTHFDVNGTHFDINVPVTIEK